MEYVCVFALVEKKPEKITHLPRLHSACVHTVRDARLITKSEQFFMAFALERTRQSPK